MGKSDERRSEQRLLYRWPVRFFLTDALEPFSAQMFDLSSTATAFLCDSQGLRPAAGQKISVNFGVPHFNNDSFDTVFFERNGSVFRTENLAERIISIVVVFDEPLFFKPGQQNIDQADAEQRLQKHAISMFRAEEKAKSLRIALTQAEEKTRQFAQSKAKLEQMLKNEIENRAKFEAEIRLEAQQEIVRNIENTAGEQEKARLQMEEKTAFYTKQINALKTDFASKISEVKKNVEKTLLQLEDKYRTTGYNKIAIKEINCKKKKLLEQLDKVITDTNRIF